MIAAAGGGAGALFAKIEARAAKAAVAAVASASSTHSKSAQESSENKSTPIASSSSKVVMIIRSICNSSQ